MVSLLIPPSCTVSLVAVMLLLVLVLVVVVVVIVLVVVLPSVMVRVLHNVLQLGVIGMARMLEKAP